MKKIYRVIAFALAAALLLTACGKGDENSAKENTPTTTGATVHYEDYITPVVDRKLVDCIETWQVAEALQCSEMDLEVIAKDSMVDYFVMAEEDPTHLQLLLENKTRDAFDAIVADTTLWHVQENMGEAAYWSEDWSQLIAYQNGYAVSVYLNKNDTMAMLNIMEIILTQLS